MQLLNKGVIILILVYLLFGSINFIQAQNNSQQKFLIGAYMQSSFNPDTAKYSLWRAKHLGINAPIIYSQRAHIDNDTLIHYTGNPLDVLSNLGTLEDYENVIALNPLASYKVLDGTLENTDIRNFDWIYFYSGAYYSKWDATNIYPWSDSLVLKHETGVLKTINGKTYWSSDGAIINKYLIFGPNYRQETRYRGSKYPNDYNDMQTYKAYFNLSLAELPLPGHENDPICEISVRSSYTIGSDPTIMYESLDSAILTRAQIGNPDYQTLLYDYSDYCQNAFLMVKEVPQQDCLDKKLIDVEFKVKWLGGQELLIDYIEVYDKDIWENWLSNADAKERAKVKIINYLNYFKNENWSFYNNNLKFFHGVDEPHSVDCYAAHKFIVDLLDSLNNVWSEGAPQLFTHFYPGWSGDRDREKTMPRFINTVNPKPFHFYYAPYRDDATIEISLEGLRNILQLSTEANQRRDFYFTLDVWDQPSIKWRRPTPSELNAGVMLALSHGAKGIIYEPMYSYITEGPELVGGLWKPEPDQNELFDIGIKVRDEINPRLSGILGNTLIELDYTGHYINIDNQEQLLNLNNHYDFLTIQPTGNSFYWHAGFLNQKNYQDNKYFLLSNLMTISSNDATLNITNNTGYENLTVRDVEDNSNTINTTLAKDEVRNFNVTVPAGEGYLFQVAPVVLYGGKLVYNETVGSGITLTDDMTIESGATLTVNGTYTAEADITVRAGGKIKYGTSNSKIVFNNGAKLIIEGNAQVYGVSNNRLTLDFSSSSYGEGVIVKPGAVLTMNYCNVQNAETGVTLENGSSANISNVNFTNYTSKGIMLFGFDTESNPTLPTPVIYNCSITGSSIGITVLNFNEVVIKSNTINQCPTAGIFLYGVSSAYISSNNITGLQSVNDYQNAGVLMLNCGGYLRNNTLRYNGTGVQLVYSSPDMGVNTIEENYKCGLYIDVGSYPNLVQQLVNPDCWYPIGGCNIITNNGTYTGAVPSTPEIQPDGAEIFLNTGDVILSYGFNEISDDRTGIPEYLTLPLIKGTRSREGTREFFVDHNY